jgi:hypothetical protein
VHSNFIAGNDVSLVAMASKKMAAIVTNWVLQDSLITKIVQRLPSEGDKTVDKPEKVIKSIKRTVKNEESGKQANRRTTFFCSGVKSLLLPKEPHF